jgi:hypothetical protein
MPRTAARRRADELLIEALVPADERMLEFFSSR